MLVLSSCEQWQLKLKWKAAAAAAVTDGAPVLSTSEQTKLLFIDDFDFVFICLASPPQSSSSWSLFGCSCCCCFSCRNCTGLLSVSSVIVLADQSEEEEECETGGLIYYCHSIMMVCLCLCHCAPLCPILIGWQAQRINWESKGNSRKSIHPMQTSACTPPHIVANHIKEKEEIFCLFSLLQRQKHQQQQQRRREKTKLKFFPNRARATFERETVNRGKRASAQKLVFTKQNFFQDRDNWKSGIDTETEPEPTQSRDSQP